MSSETAYESSSFKVAEIQHRYGANVHLVDDPVAWSLLARACARETLQPEVGRLVRMLYEDLARRVIAAEFPRELMRVPTRMVGSHPQAVARFAGIAHRTPVVTVGIARAGTVPSQVIYELLNEIVEPALVRQDHLFMSREVNEAGEVTGARWHDAKIGREVGGRIILFPDPMGATGSSMSSAVTHYKTRLEGQPSRIVALHLIVTPEYLRRLQKDHPDVIVYALRLDRGLSAPEILATVPGERWDDEVGLNDHQYIVPGAGGVGEILNNSWV
ncbi:MAG TPA: uracil phosphoribosyltransferase [Polyangiaceae bacterium]|nr:uracil phosphoribosyltransferase [Polyangiaceae bacterium]